MVFRFQFTGANLWNPKMLTIHLWCVNEFIARLEKTADVPAAPAGARDRLLLIKVEISTRFGTKAQAEAVNAVQAAAGCT